MGRGLVVGEPRTLHPRRQTSCLHSTEGDSGSVLSAINWESVREHSYLIWAIPIRKPWLSSGGFLSFLFSFLLIMLGRRSSPHRRFLLFLITTVGSEVSRFYVWSFFLCFRPNVSRYGNTIIV